MISFKILFLLIATSLSADKLVFLMTHFRHGARAPQKYYDEVNHLDYVLESWKNPGELTPIGQRMHYALGLHNREKYIDQLKFLSNQFDPHEILIYSTRLNRTLLSAACHLQGLYPPGTGGKITEAQKDNAVPQVKLSDDVKKILNELNLNSLPNGTSVAPIRMINDNDKKMIIYDIPDCLWKRDEMREINYKNSKELQNIVQSFSDKYSGTLNQMYGKENTYDIDFVDNFCDAFISAKTELLKMEKLSSTNINQTELLNTCFEFMKLNFRDWISGDEERTLPTLEVSKLMREFIHYMRQRINADINKENITAKLEDFSRPKMLMISAHDSTVSMWEMFLIKVFYNNDKTKYTYPKFASQLTFEVFVDDSIQEKKLSDYIINCTLNNDLFLSKNVEEFINEVEKNLYDDDKIDEICKFKSKTDVYFILTIVFSVTTGLFLILTIIFIIKAFRKRDSDSIIKEGRLLNNSDSSFQ